MDGLHRVRTELSEAGPFAFVAGGCILLAISLLVIEPWLVPLVVMIGLAALLQERRQQASEGRQIAQIDRLREAELALAASVDTATAARDLAHHTIALLGAPSATVLIEGIGDTVRVGAGTTRGSVYGPGSRMRLLDDAGVPCGSISVSARADGRPYTPQQEHMLDALAQRVSSTLHRLSLFTEVQEERATLADVVGSSSNGIFSVGADLAVLSWNPAMEHITGVPANQARHRPAVTVFRPVDAQGRPRHHAPTEPTVDLVRIDRRGAAEGTEDVQRWLTCSWSPLTKGGYVCVVRDDTERKQLQDDKDGWIAQVSHELRTPLTPLKGFLHTLLRRDEHLLDADRHHIYEVMLREEQRLEHLVNALLQATTNGTDSAPTGDEPVDWPDLLDTQAELLRRGEPPREVTLAIGAGVDDVVVDRTLATDVVTNLLTNAVKYSPADTPIEIDAAIDGAVLIVSVSDHGAGIQPADRERVFEKFTRLGNHLTRPQQGVGLGLFLARRAVEQLGGTIWCDDRPGGGARFSFRLPLQPPSAADANPSSKAARRHRTAHQLTTR